MHVPECTAQNVLGVGFNETNQLWLLLRTAFPTHDGVVLFTMMDVNDWLGSAVLNVVKFKQLSVNN